MSFHDAARRIWRSLLRDRLFGNAAELGFYFLFALFPTLICASSIVGLAVRSVHSFYERLLDYLALVLPTEALGTVLNTFNETAAAASPGKLTFGLIAAIWSASVGVSAVQDTLNGIYKNQDSRSYFEARVSAIGLTLLLIVIATIGLASLLAGDLIAAFAYHTIHSHILAVAIAGFARSIGWSFAIFLLILSFAAIYYLAPDGKGARWHWLTPGGAIGITGWIVASLGFRIYIHYFNNYSITYGSLGAVIMLLTWFYISGLMLLLGAEINREIDLFEILPAQFTGSK